MKSKGSFHLEKIGNIGALFALACCLGLGPVIALMSAVGASFLIRDAILGPLLLVFLGVGLAGLVLSRRKHHRWEPAALNLLSGAGMYAFTFVSYSKPFIWASVAGLVAASVLDWILRRRCGFGVKHSYDYDIVIVGSGSAAFAAALRAGELGAKVAITEPREVGGTCVNRGCVPSKTLIRAAELYHLAGHHAFDGVNSHQGDVDFAALARQKDDLVQLLRQHKYVDLAAGNERITMVEGEAGFIDSHTVRVGEQRLTGAKFLIASGARPIQPPINGLDDVPYLTSDLLSTEPEHELTELPESLLIIGGGVIALELGQLFQRLGTQVTMLHRGPRLLSRVDEDITATLKTIIEEEGLACVCDASVRQVRGDGARVEVIATVSGEARHFTAQRLLVAAGVRPNTEALNLQAVGVSVDEKGFVKVDATMKTTARHIWAAGDVSGEPLATPVSAREGSIAADNMMDTCSRRRMDYKVVPRAVFTDPEVATVGLTLEQARLTHPSAEARTMGLDVVPKAACIRDTRGLVKMVIDGKTHRILGVHVVAHNAADIIHEAAVAIRAGWTTDDLIATIHVYPTMAEAIRMVAQTFTKDVSKLSCCAE